MSNSSAIDRLEALLPQTQCGDCGYPGCRPYATALVAGAPIDRCLPGGVATLKQLANQLKQDSSPYTAAMRQKAKKPQRAIINEPYCIGCTKCIQACPVDAIIGTTKHTHTILSDECTGCELCIPACPVDCIELKALSAPQYQRAHAYARFKAKQQRHNARVAPIPLKTTLSNQITATVLGKQSYIAQARAKKQWPDHRGS